MSCTDHRIGWKRSNKNIVYQNYNKKALKHSVLKPKGVEKKSSTSNSSTFTSDLNTLSSKTHIVGLLDSSCIQVKIYNECPQYMHFFVTKVELTDHVRMVHKKIVSFSEINFQCRYCKMIYHI